MRGFLSCQKVKCWHSVRPAVAADEKHVAHVHEAILHLPHFQRLFPVGREHNARAGGNHPGAERHSLSRNTLADFVLVETSACTNVGDFGTVAPVETLRHAAFRPVRLRLPKPSPFMGRVTRRAGRGEKSPLRHCVTPPPRCGEA